jgi:hypothetical protein
MKQYNFFNFFTNFNWKKALIFLPVPLLAHLESVIYPLITLFIVINLDLLTGLVSYFYKLRKEISRPLILNDYRYGVVSGGIRQTIIKSYQYGMAFIVLFIIEMMAFKGSYSFEVPLIGIQANLSQFLLWALVMIEVKSIDENLKGVSGKSLFESIGQTFQFFRDFVNKITGKTQDTRDWEEYPDDEAR